ncbi:MAG: histidine phosphatase family protein [Oscillospiraceae bacterium]
MVTTVYLVRHAEAMGNVNEVFQGHTDCEVSPKGKLQLECLKERFNDIPFDAIFTSPLARAVETAEAVNFYHNLEIQKDVGLMEINGGVFEGKKWAELPVLFPEFYSLWLNDLAKFKVENGETMEQVYNRITLTVTKLAARNRGKTIVLVSHGCAIKNFLCYANEMPLSRISEVQWAENTSVSKFLFDNNLKPTIVFQNDAAHLTDEVATLRHQTWWRGDCVKA